jgi:DNA processing protein
MTALTAAPDHRIALATLMWAADGPDPSLISLLDTMSADQAVALIRAGELPATRDLPAPAARRFLEAGSMLRTWQNRLRNAPADGGLKEAERLGFRLVAPSDPLWPTALDDLGPDRPCALWVRGADLPATGVAGRSVAVDGSRAATAYGCHVAAMLAGDLAASGTTLSVRLR